MRDVDSSGVHANLEYPINVLLGFNLANGWAQVIFGLTRATCGLTTFHR